MFIYISCICRSWSALLLVAVFSILPAEQGKQRAVRLMEAVCLGWYPRSRLCHISLRESVCVITVIAVPALCVWPVHHELLRISLHTVCFNDASLERCKLWDHLLCWAQWQITARENRKTEEIQLVYVYFLKVLESHSTRCEDGKTHLSSGDRFGCCLKKSPEACGHREEYNHFECICSSRLVYNIMSEVFLCF